MLVGLPNSERSYGPNFGKFVFGKFKANAQVTTNQIPIATPAEKYFMDFM
jgi:hypothetical protein